jgi:hypothetical protein
MHDAIECKVGEAEVEVSELYVELISRKYRAKSAAPAGYFLDGRRN